MWAGVPKRFRRPLGVTWAATAIAIALAVGPFLGGEYDATLAVITATLITVIWYTYFTYRAVHREPGTFLLTGLATAPGKGFFLLPTVSNPMPRAVSTRVHLDVWVDGQPVDLGPFYRGEEPQMLDAHQDFQGSLDLRDRLRHHVDNGNFRWDTREMCARMQVRWADTYGEAGSTFPLHFWWQSPDSSPTVLVAPSDIAAHFNTLTPLSPADPRTIPPANA